MTIAAISVTDEEFSLLMGTNMQLFAARLRAETTAHALKERIAAVAEDLRQWVSRGDVADPRGVSRIANAFDHLAYQMETEICHNDTARWYSGDGAEDMGVHRECDISEYDIEAWHGPTEEFPGKGIEGH